jgi:hypothetical protein
MIRQEADFKGIRLRDGVQVGLGRIRGVGSLCGQSGEYCARYLRLGMAASTILFFNLEAPEHFGLKKSFNFPDLGLSLRPPEEVSG